MAELLLPGQPEEAPMSAAAETEALAKTTAQAVADLARATSAAVADVARATAQSVAEVASSAASALHTREVEHGALISKLLERSEGAQRDIALIHGALTRIEERGIAIESAVALVAPMRSELTELSKLEAEEHTLDRERAKAVGRVGRMLAGAAGAIIGIGIKRAFGG